MYLEVGKYVGESRHLLSEISRFDLRASSEGYATSSNQPELAKEVFQPVLKDTFPGEWLSAMLTVILPNGCIPSHCDSDVAGGKATRYHLVLQSNDQSWSMHDNEWQRLREGYIYTIDPALIHGSINWGKEPRVHLVIDISSSTGAA